jgi:hypothetical protein
MRLRILDADILCINAVEMLLGQMSEQDLPLPVPVSMYGD